MVTVRNLKAMLGLDTSAFLSGMRDAATKTKQFKSSLSTAATKFEELEVIINASKINMSKIPKAINFGVNKKTLVDSLQKHMKSLDKIGKAGFFLTVNKTALKESIDKWIDGLRGGTRLTKLPLKVDKAVLTKSITAAIAELRTYGDHWFRRKENMLPLQADVSVPSGKGGSKTGGMDLIDINETLEKILNSIGTGSKSLKEHVDDAGKSGGMDPFGGGGMPF